MTIAADLAFIYHWQPSEIWELDLEDLLEFHRLATEHTKVWAEVQGAKFK